MEKLVTIRGLVVPAGWDSTGRVQQVAIAAFDESEYLVSPGGQSERLAGLLHREVTVAGGICRQDGRPASIQVNRIISGCADQERPAVRPAFDYHPCLVLI